MAPISKIQFRSVLALFILSSFFLSCSTKKTTKYFGQTAAPKNNILRYVSGSEPESLDPQFVTGQPEARLMMAIYDGLVEYHPKTMEAIPAIAESWELSPDGTEYIFNLRKTAKFSNGDPITAKDFVFTFRRGLSPELASRNANLAYYIKYSEAYNAGRSFVRGADGEFLLKNDPDHVDDEKPPAARSASFGPDSDFHRFLNGPERLSVPTDPKERAKFLGDDEKLKAAIQGKELVPVKAEDIGVEALDDYTLRLKLYQPAPFFLGLLAHQFFRVLSQPAIEKFGKEWLRPENIVTSGAFKVASYKPYDELVVTRDPNYWDAANVKLDGIKFYPLEEQTTMLNLYKAGEVDATYNHTIPAPWNEVVRQYTAEYSLHPEAAVEYYSLSVKKPPMDNIKVRKALALAIDRDALAQFRKTVKPLVDFTPQGIFPKYEEARTKIYTELLTDPKRAKDPDAEHSLDEWKARKFNAVKARRLMGEAGFPVQGSEGNYSSPTFPVEKVTITYNTAESNQRIAEFIQAQWKQNLGISIPLKNMEFKTFLPFRSAVEYQGAVRNGWVGDYMDPFTFLNLFYSPQNDGATGWWDAKYDKMLDDANKETDEMKRYEMLARAEFYVIDQQVVIPLSTNGTSWVKKPYVKGMYPNPGTLHPWKFVYIEQDQGKWTEEMEGIMAEKDPAVEDQINQLMASQEQMQKSKTAELAKTAAKKPGE